MERVRMYMTGGLWSFEEYSALIALGAEPTVWPIGNGWDIGWHFYANYHHRPGARFIIAGIA